VIDGIFSTDTGPPERLEQRNVNEDQHSELQTLRGLGGSFFALRQLALHSDSRLSDEVAKCNFDRLAN